MNLFTAVAAEIGAVAPVAGFDKMDIRIGENANVRFRQEADEGIVLSTKNERGNGDAVDDTGAGGAVIVVVGVTESAIAGDDFVVELSDGADRADGRPRSINVRKQVGFAGIAVEETAEEAPLVDAIGGLVERIGSGREVDGGTDGGHSTEERTGSPLACELEDEIAAHGVADKCKATQAEEPSIMTDDCTYVSREARVVEGGSERFAAAAVAHVHADHIAAGGPGAHGNALHITGVRGAL